MMMMMTVTVVLGGPEAANAYLQSYTYFRVAAKRTNVSAVESVYPSRHIYAAPRVASETEARRRMIVRVVSK